MNRQVLAGLTALAMTGCGLLQTRGPDPDRPPDRRPDCTESMDAPTRDAIPAALGFASILVGLLFLEADDNQEVGVPLIVGGAVVTAGAYASGGIGYFRVKRCRKAVEEWERAQERSSRMPRRSRRTGGGRPPAAPCRTRRARPPA